MSDFNWEITQEAIEECRLIIANLKHEIGPNRLVNDEEVDRLTGVINNKLSQIETNVLFSLMSDMFYAIEVYNPGFSIIGVHTVAQLAVLMSVELIVNREDFDAVQLAIIMTRDRLFELYLVDTDYYRAICSAFYKGLRLEPWAQGFGFYDCRHDYAPQKAIGSPKAVDADFIVLTDFYAQLGMSYISEDRVCKYTGEWAGIVDLSNRFWRMIAHDISHVILVWRNEADQIIDNALSQQWNGLAFLTAMVGRKYRKQVSIVKALGCNNLSNVKDLRKIKISSLIPACGIFACIVAMTFFGYGLWDWLGKFGLIAYLVLLVPLYFWVFKLTSESRDKVSRKMSELSPYDYVYSGIGFRYINPYATYSPDMLRTYFALHPEQRWLLY